MERNLRSARSAGGVWGWGRRAVVGAVLLLVGVGVGCEGRREAKGSIVSRDSTGVREGEMGKAEVRREFVVLRELVKQHALQSEAGNEGRLETVERHLRERVEKVSDEGVCEEEREIVRQAREVVEKLGARGE